MHQRRPASLLRGEQPHVDDPAHAARHGKRTLGALTLLLFISRTALRWTSRLFGRDFRSWQISASGTESANYDRDAYTVEDDETWAELCESLQRFLTAIHIDVTDLSSLPADFDYSYALVAYVWTVVIFAAKTIGHRVARFGHVEDVLDAVLNRWCAFLFVYMLAPTYLVLLNVKISKKQLSLHARRVIIISVAFLFGLFGEYIWLHFLHAPTAPYYYFPLLVGVVLQLVGPFLSNNRAALLAACVSTTVVVSVAIASFMKVLTFSYFVATLVSAVQSVFNLQLLIADLKKHGSDEKAMVCGHYRVLIVSTYTHAILTLLCAKYRCPDVNQSDAAI